MKGPLGGHFSCSLADSQQIPDRLTLLDPAQHPIPTINLTLLERAQVASFWSPQRFVSLVRLQAAEHLPQRPLHRNPVGYVLWKMSI